MFVCVIRGYDNVIFNKKLQYIPIIFHSLKVISNLQYLI